MGINGKGTATSLRQAIKQFLMQDIDESGSRGRIVNIFSSAGITVTRNETAYIASKAAVSMLTKSLTLDHAKGLTNVNAVCPGVARTAMASTNLRDLAIINKLKKGTPWPWLGEPSDIAKVVAFL
ncbi:hypothetical protein SEUCBS139899_007714 [Sporothrix eucalyptigena]